MIKALFILAAISITMGCQSKPKPKIQTPTPVTKDSAVSPIKNGGGLHDPLPLPAPSGPTGVVCLTMNKDFEGRYGTISLPITGKTVEESHYLTQEDQKKVSSISEAITSHIARSKEFYPSSIYNLPWQKQWTPAEGGGLIGVGARTDWRPTVQEEIWQGNMFFKTLPKLGTRFLACNEKAKKCAILHFGYEIGPNKKYGIAGVTTEAYQYLKAGTSEITFKYLVDQTLPFGPVVCE